MNIGFDAKRAFLNFTGLGNYSRFIIKILSDFYPEHRYHLYTPPYPRCSELLFMEQLFNAHIHQASGWGRYFPALWRSMGVTKDLRRDKIDVYHGLSHELPHGISKKGIKTVVTVHDTLFLRYPQFYKIIDRGIYSYKIHDACRQADQIVAVSQQTKADIIQFLKIPEKKIKVIYQGCHPIFHNKVNEEDKTNVRIKYALPDKYLLYVGTIEERKNLLCLLKALTKVNSSIKLAAVGRSTKYMEILHSFIKDHNLQDRIRFIHQAHFHDLPAIYQMASVFIYPAFFEGFGIPILEALYSGVPVITSLGSCFSETAGPQSIFIDPHKPEELANALNTLLADESLRSKMIEAGYLHTKQFSDEQIAQQLMKTYQELIF